MYFCSTWKGYIIDAIISTICVYFTTHMSHTVSTLTPGRSVLISQCQSHTKLLLNCPFFLVISMTRSRLRTTNLLFWRRTGGWWHGPFGVACCFCLCYQLVAPLPVLFLLFFFFFFLFPFYYYFFLIYRVSTNIKRLKLIIYSLERRNPSPNPSSGKRKQNTTAAKIIKYMNK